MLLGGLQRAQRVLAVRYVVIQPRAVSEFRSVLARASAIGFDLIIGTSFDMVDPMQQIARAFPRQDFGLIDVGPDPLADNITSTLTKDWEGACLAGWLAAQTSRTGVIGFIGGKEIPIIRRFFTGYYYGARLASPSTRVLESYTGSFTEPALGKEYAQAMAARRADVIFAAAGATGAGVIDAARGGGLLAIGVDSDQDGMAPGHVLTSLVKHVDGQAFDMIRSVVDGSFRGGRVLRYGLTEDGGVSLALDKYNRPLLAPDLLQRLGDLRDRIRSGAITVPNFFDLKPGQGEMGSPPIEVPASLRS